MVQRERTPSAMQETKEMWFRSLGWEDPLEEDYSYIPMEKIPWTEGPSGLQPMG